MKIAFAMNVTKVTAKPAVESMGRSFVDDAAYDEIDNNGSFVAPVWPCVVHVMEVSTAELRTVHLLTKNKPRVKIMCDNFYSETEVCEHLVCVFVLFCFVLCCVMLCCGVSVVVCVYIFYVLLCIVCRIRQMQRALKSLCGGTLIGSLCWSTSKAL